MTKLFENIPYISLSNPYPNGVPVSTKSLLEPYVQLIEDIRIKIIKGQRVYFGIMNGEHKGAVAYVSSLNTYYTRQPVRVHCDQVAYVVNGDIDCTLAWDDREDTVQWSTHEDTVYFPLYTGPTVWAEFNEQVAIDQALKDNPPLDRDRNVLAVGDRVVYVDVQNESIVSINKGMVVEVYANVFLLNGKSVATTHVIVQSDSGQQSDIRESELRILKLNLTR